jgi:hypothetical protein
MMIKKAERMIERAKSSQRKKAGQKGFHARAFQQGKLTFSYTTCHMRPCQ